MITELELELAICNRLEHLLPDLYEEGYRLESRQALLETNRLDLVLKHPIGKYLIIELKKGLPPREVIEQLGRYLHFWKVSHPDKPVDGMVIGNELHEGRKAEITSAGYFARAIDEDSILQALRHGFNFADIPSGVNFSKLDPTGQIRFLLSDHSKIVLPHEMLLAPPWNQEKVFHALIRKGMRHKDLWKKNVYVVLYPHKPNCAILYHPDSEQVVNAAPLHFNPRQEGWNQELFDELAPFIRFSHSDAGKDTIFDWYSPKGKSDQEIEQSWNGIAETLRLNTGAVDRELDSRAANESAMIEIDCPSDTLYGLPVPRSILDLQRLKVTDYESSNPGLGLSIGYRADNLELTIYFYDMRLDEVPDDIHGPIVRHQFELVTDEVLASAKKQGTPMELITCYVVGKPQFGEAFLAAKFIGQDDQTPFTSLALLSTKANKFVKLRITCRSEPEVAEARVRGVVEAYSDLLWEGQATFKTVTNQTQHCTLIDPDHGEFAVLGLVTIQLPPIGIWHGEDIDTATAKGVAFRAYDEKSREIGDGEIALLMIGDVTDDPTEPDVREIKDIDVPAIDDQLRKAAEVQLKESGRELVHWTPSFLNRTKSIVGLVTGYILREDGIEKQYIDVRVTVRGRKLVIDGMFDVSKQESLAPPIFSALEGVVFLS